MLRTTAARHGPLAAGVLLVAALVAAPARAADALNYFKNYFVTGDYVAVGVGLQHTGVNGFATGTLTVDPAQIPPRRGGRRRRPLLADHLLPRCPRPLCPPGSEVQGQRHQQDRCAAQHVRHGAVLE